MSSVRLHADRCAVGPNHFVQRNIWKISGEIKMHRKTFVHVMELMHRQPDLPQVTSTLRPAADSRAACTAGSSRRINMPMIAITTNSSN